MRRKDASDDDEVTDDYVIRVHDDPAMLDASAWDALVQAQPSRTPFMRHAYLLALHRSGSAVAKSGWHPQFLVVERGEQLVAACPLYLKDHSYGEYMFLCSIVSMSM